MGDTTAKDTSFDSLSDRIDQLSERQLKYVLFFILGADTDLTSRAITFVEGHVAP